MKERKRRRDQEEKRNWTLSVKSALISVYSILLLLRTVIKLKTTNKKSVIHGIDIGTHNIQCANVRVDEWIGFVASCLYSFDELWIENGAAFNLTHEMLDTINRATEWKCEFLDHVTFGLNQMDFILASCVFALLFVMCTVGN